ncbi:hypothetical protein [Actinophytocola sp.]|jgi:hypothetical protein|uniref:hypothetical protein n=1 Tax=Actinophytocola sp. TaxID=1872138 RepID=UPI002ED77295
MGLPEIWGATPAEIADHYPCDDLVPGPTESWFRAVDVDASPAAVYRWLCQLRVAPYSYDLIDNLGRRSPRTLTPGLSALAVGQRVATIFTLVDFVPGRELTLRLTDRQGLRMFGDLAITYRATASTHPVPDRSPRPTPGRLVAKLAVSATPRSYLRRRLLAWGDLVMMRRQLHNLAHLAGSSTDLVA